MDGHVNESFLDCKVLKTFPYQYQYAALLTKMKFEARWIFAWNYKQ